MPRNLAYITFLLLACHSPVKYPPGGYDYPEVVADKDTNNYYYPVRNMFSRVDSFRLSFNDEFYHNLDEPNISLKPRGEDLLRLSWWGYYGQDEDTEVVILLRPRSITVKTAHLNPAIRPENKLFDSTRLTPTENYLMGVLWDYYQVSNHSPRRKQRMQHLVDSLWNLYPQLHDPLYYRSLYQKIVPRIHPYYLYTSRTIPISRKKFKKLVDSINASGFWKLHPDRPVDPDLTGATSYILEANTESKYNMVRSWNNPDDTTMYLRACEQLVRAAHMDKTIALTWHSQRKSDTSSSKPPFIIQDVRIEEVKEPKPRRRHSK